MNEHEPRQRERSAWTIVLAGGGLLAVVASLGLVSPRPRHGSEPPGAPVLSMEHEPPPSRLVVPPPAPDGDRTSPRAPPAREPAPGAVVAGRVDAGREAPAPLPALPAPPELSVLEIRVSRAGRPVPGAAIELVHAGGDQPSDTAPLPSLHRSDEQGRLRLGLAPGSARAVAWDENACALPAEGRLDPGAETLLELELEPSFPVAGRVLDVRGRPVAGAAVALWTFAERDTVTSGPDGSFLHPRFPARAPAQQIAARAEGYGIGVRYLRVDADGGWKLSAASREEASLKGSGTPWVELVLVPELRVHGRILGPDGAPLAGARASAEGFFHALPSVASRDGATTTSGADGSFALAGLRSDVGHSLLLEAEGFALEVLELDAPATELDLGSLVLARECALAGVALDQDGRPLEGAEVVLSLAPAVLAAAPRGSLDVGARLQGRELRVRTTPEGTFLFTNLPPRPVSLSLAHENGAEVGTTLVPRPDGSFDAPCLVLPPPPLILARDP